MPHQRPRQLLEILNRRLRHFPVVGVLGARQSGKSTLIRELLGEKRSIQYVTLDREENRRQAERSPSLFIQGLESREHRTVVIDKIQKAPVLFDTLKAEVDENRRPGRFLITGSTEFSKKTGVRESLTGRISLTHLFPLNLGEIDPKSSNRLPLSRLRMGKGSVQANRAIKLWITHGGMPGIFAIRDAAHRESQFQAWIETTCYRDLAQFSINRFKPDLAQRILEALARCEVPARLEIAKTLGMLPRQLDPYLEAFQALHILHRIEPHASGIGKSHYLLFDAGIANALGASEKRRLEIWFLNEVFSQFSYAGLPRPHLFYYLSSKHSKIDFVVEQKGVSLAVLLSDEESPHEYSLRPITSFKNRNPTIPVVVLSPCLRAHPLQNGATIHPWSSAI